MITALLITAALQQGETPDPDIQALADSFCYTPEEIDEKLEDSISEMVFICPPDGLYIIDLDCHQACLDEFIARHYQNYTDLCNEAQELVDEYEIEASIIDATWDHCMPNCWEDWARDMRVLRWNTIANIKDLSTTEKFNDALNQGLMHVCMRDCCIRIDIATLASLGKEALTVGVPLPGIDLVELSLISQGIN